MAELVDALAELLDPDVHPLRQLRQLRGLSLRELGAHAGISKSELDRFERGEKRPDPATQTRLAAALRVPLEAAFPPQVDVVRPAAEPPQRRERTPEDERVHAAARTVAENWVRRTGRRMFASGVTASADSLRDELAGKGWQVEGQALASLLDAVDWQELLALALELGSGEKTLPYLQQVANARRDLSALIARVAKNPAKRLAELERGRVLSIATRHNLEPDDTKELLELAEQERRYVESTSRRYDRHGNQIG